MGRVYSYNPKTHMGPRPQKYATVIQDVLEYCSSYWYCQWFMFKSVSLLLPLRSSNLALDNNYKLCKEVQGHKFQMSDKSNMIKK